MSGRVPSPESPVPVVTIDGPSGVGKGTIARAVARVLGWHLLDSGALYRILALAAQRAGVPLDDSAAVAQRAPALDIRFDTDTGERERIVVNGADWTDAIRAESTGGLASQIATAPAVRAALLARQRAFRQAPGLVADGRDMGTVVFPDAAAKVFLDATPEERARRRFRQLRDAGRPAIIDRLCTEIRDRDARDRGRSVAPLRPADDARVIDTTSITPEAVTAEVMQWLHSRGVLQDAPG